MARRDSIKRNQVEVQHSTNTFMTKRAETHGKDFVKGFVVLKIGHHSAGQAFKPCTAAYAPSNPSSDTQQNNTAPSCTPHML
jgi:hypothetical protein